MTCAISIFLIIALVGTSVAGTCPVLTPSGPVTITAHSQVVENLEIDTARGTATSPTSGISCNGFDHVIIRNVRVTHHVEGTGISQGISFTNCNHITIHNARVQLTGHESGALPNWRDFNIMGSKSKGARIDSVILSGGSSGVWLGDCVDPKFTNWAVYNVQGPFPRGQCVQYGRCTRGIVDGFICKNQWNYAWPEDAISMWRSANSTVRNGVILGNNAPTGVSVMFEQSVILDNSWGLAENIEVSNTGGGFSTYGGTNIVFKNVAIKDNHCDGKGGREPPRSGGLMYYAGYEQGVGSSNVSIVNGTWYNSCDRNKKGDNIVIFQDKRNPSAWAKAHDYVSMGQDLVQKDFPIDAHPIKLQLCFSIGGTNYIASTMTERNVGLVGDGSVAYSASNVQIDYDEKMAVSTEKNTPIVVIVSIFGICALVAIIFLVVKLPAGRIGGKASSGRDNKVREELLSDSMCPEPSQTDYAKLSA